jgi:hypothetical protein
MDGGSISNLSEKHKKVAKNAPTFLIMTNFVARIVDYIAVSLPWQGYFCLFHADVKIRYHIKH